MRVTTEVSPSPSPAWTLLPALALAAFAAWWLDGAWARATTAEASDLAVYWATAQAWAPGDALPPSEAVRAVTDRHLGGAWVYPAWGLLLWEPVAHLPFDEVRRGWAGVLLGCVGLTLLGWLLAASPRKRPAAAAGLGLALVVFQRGIDNALHQGNAELLLAAVLALAAAALGRRPALGGGLVGLAAAIKLWPAALVAMAPPGAMRRVAMGAAVVGGALLLPWIVRDPGPGDELARAGVCGDGGVGGWCREGQGGAADVGPGEPDGTR